MTKWADYLISEVSYTETDKTKYISKVKMHVDNGETVEASATWKKSDVLNSIDDKKSFITIYKTNDGKWKKGEDVRKIKINEKYYLRTDANKKEEDNLGNLPEF